jgi:hypothetical protein
MAQFTCREKGIDPDTTDFSLTAENIGVTDVWLKIKLQQYAQHEIILKRDTTTILQTTLNTSDTIIADEGLFPNHRYAYTLIQSVGFGLKPETRLIITTMDTTSHNFTWEIDTLGDGNSSALYDIAIINDTLAYAVGEIYKRNSLGQYNTDPYNFLKCNGKKWEMKSLTFVAIQAVFAFSENDIWVGSTVLRHWNGSTWTTWGTAQGFPWGFWINKIWGTSSSNLYVIGDNGNIVHYNGTSWQKVESGTTLALADIYGASNIMTIAGVNMSVVKGIVLKNNETSWQTIGEGEIITSNELFKPKLYGSIMSVWIDEKNTIYAGGNLFYKYQFGKWSYVTSLPENYIEGNPNVYYRGFIHKIRGNKSNDLWIVGDRNTIRHFNGISWQQIGMPYDPASDIIWRSVDVKDNFCVAVGDGENKAICIRIRK